MLGGEEVKLTIDATAYVDTAGLIGEKYLELVPGDPLAPPLEAGGIIIGEGGIAMGRFLTAGYEGLEQMKELFTGLQAIVGSEEAQAEIRGIISNSEEATANLTSVLANADVILGKMARGEGTIGKLLVEEEVYNDVKATVKDVKTHPWKLLFRPRGRK